MDDSKKPVDIDAAWDKAQDLEGTTAKKMAQLLSPNPIENLRGLGLLPKK